MRNERASRGLGDGGGLPQRAPQERPKTGSGPPKFPRKTVGGEPRQVEYDDPFMRIERASRLPPDQPHAPKVKCSLPSIAAAVSHVGDLTGQIWFILLNSPMLPQQNADLLTLMLLSLMSVV